MNAPTSIAALAAPTVELVAVTALEPSSTHIQEMRRARFDLKLIDELAASVGQVGLLQPILARPSQANGRADRYEIVAGERRWLAAKKAGLKEIPVSVRSLSDEQVLEVQLIENLQREGLHELEEAEGYEELMKLKSISAEVVADMVGKSKSYVFKRVKLLSLCPDGRKAFYAGELDAGSALLIARIQGVEVQKRAMKDLAEQRQWGDVKNLKEAADFLRDNFMLRLKEAPFDRTDAELVPAVGSCDRCPKRTGNQRDIFGDIKDGDLCSDAKCFDSKRQAQYAIAVALLGAKGQKVIHGDAAKKIVKNWEDNSSYHHLVGYVALDEYSPEHGGKVKDVLPADFEPTLIQHPFTGKIFEAASSQALTKAKLKKKQGKTSAPAKAAKPKGPDVDEQLLERLVKNIHEKAPKEFGKAHLQILVKRLLSHLNTRDGERQVVAKQFGWAAKAMTSGGYGASAKLPAEALKLDVRGLTLLMFQLTFLADRYPNQRKEILDLFGLDEDKTRELIIVERKIASREAREQAKKGKKK